MKKLGVAVLGGSLLGRNHARIFKELPNTELVVVCDVDSERAQTVAENLAR